jgi:hypothetical protein
MAEGALAPFEARYSIPKLLGWLLLAAPFAAFSAVLLAGGLRGGNPFVAILGAIGLLFFGGAVLGLLRSLIDRRIQLRIDDQGLLLRAHSARPIPLRSIRKAGLDSGRIMLFLHKPAKYPIERLLRRFIYRINGSQARPFFGDAWIWTAHYNASKAEIFAAIDAHIVPTRFERDLVARIAAAQSATGDSE